MDTEDQKVLKLALKVALETRQETFLAHYPRKLKLLIAIIPFLALPHLFMNGEPEMLVLDTKLAMSQDAWTERVDRYDEHHILGDPMLESIKPEKTRSTRKIVPVTEIEKKAVAFNDDFAGVHLDSKYDAKYIEPRATGDLPKIARDGTSPWEYYARPFDLLDPRPRIALVVVDLGLSRIATDAAIQRMPGPVTLAFDVQGTAVSDWLSRARSDGHETILSLPMEPTGYPRNDPGPGTLLMSLSNRENVSRLTKFLGVGKGYVGVTTMSGRRFLNDPQKVRPVIDVMRRRGLLMLDTEVTAHSTLADLARKGRVPFAVNGMVIDKRPSPYAIEQALARVEKMAMLHGSVVAIASPLPLTLGRLQDWLKSLKNKGFALAPLSAVVIH